MIFGEMGDMVKKAREMQSNMKKIQEELKNTRYEGEAGEIKVTINGEMEILDIQAAENPNIKHIKEAVNRAIKKSKDDAGKKLKGLTGGLSIPGLF